MKGLMLKDWYILQNYRQNVIIILAISIAMALFGTGLVVVPSMCIFISCNYLLGLFSYDDASGWEKYQATMPASRRSAVAARYIVSYSLLGGVGLASFLLAAVLSLLLGALGKAQAMDITALAISTLVILLLSALIVTILLPLCYKLGVEKIRYVMFIVYAAVIAIVVGIVFLFRDTLDAIGSGPGLLAAFTGILVGVVVLIALSALASFRVSLRIYQKKEF